MDQLRRAVEHLESSRSDEDRDHASSKIRRWSDVIQGMAMGTLRIGSRQPVPGVPGWVTLEVAHGGFATGKYLAAGPLSKYEKERLAELGRTGAPSPRLHLNLAYLRPDGLRELMAMLQSGRFRIRLPEHAALLVVAWLVASDRKEAAETLVSEIEPWMDRLRFYPEPTDQPVSLTTTVHLDSVGEVAGKLEQVRQRERIEAQNESLNQWIPMHDRLVRLVVDSCESPDGATAAALGEPFSSCDDRWRKRAADLLREYAEQRRVHQRSGKPDRRGEIFCDLRRCVHQVIDLESGSAVNASVRRRTVELLVREFAKRGPMDSDARKTLRERQRREGRLPTHASVAKIIRRRLGLHDFSAGLRDPEQVLRSDLEACERAMLPGREADDRPSRITFPESIRRKVHRCLDAAVDELVAKGLVTSGDVLARLVPQVAGLEMSKRYDDVRVQRLFSQLYQAFRTRRSLLLLDLDRQNRFEDLPWVPPLMKSTATSGKSGEHEHDTFVQVAVLNLTSFPHAMVPNKLLQELRALAKAAGHSVPLIDELAVDIFTGEFSQKFGVAAKIAAGQLAGSLYARYYGIDTDALASMRFGSGHVARGLGDRCRSRSGLKSKGWSPAANGCVIEQQQILTTQNLAALCSVTEVRASLESRWFEMADTTLRWCMNRLATSSGDRHSKLIATKNAAYGWRQMMFYLSQLSRQELDGFMVQADELFSNQPETLRNRFRPAMIGLRNVVQGDPIHRRHGRVFLGWTTKKHWLLETP